MDLAIRTYAYLVTTATLLRERLADEDRGQTAVEYIAILAIVGLLVVIIYNSPLRTSLTTEIGEAIQRLFGGN